MKHQLWLRPVRIIVALLFITGFFIIFSDSKGKLPSWLYDAFTSLQFVPSVLKFITIPGVLTAGFLFVLILTVFSGRVYCSAICPLGIMQDALIFLRKLMPGVSRRRKFKRALNTIRYPVLALTVISLLFTGIFAINWLDPYANFGRIASNLYQPIFIASRNFLAKLLMSVDIYSLQPVVQKVFYPLPFFAALSVFFIILLMVLYRDRLYCNTICPVGAFLGLVSKISFLKVQIEKTSCTRCGSCQLACKANCINIKEMSIDESRCISCFNCINVCDASGIGLKNAWKKRAVEPVVEDKTKRNFLKAGLAFMGTYPLLAMAEMKNDDRPSYFHRGPISPPGSVSIRHFKNKCIACHLCISVCPTKVLQPSFLEYGFTGMMLPRLENNIGYCNYECVKCSEACPTGAIIPLSSDKKKITQIGTVFFDEDLCIVKTRGSACGSCSEHCPTQAVYMVPYRDHLTIPATNIDICIGCGACEYACPVSKPHPAIYIVPKKVHGTAQEVVTEKIEVRKLDDFPF